MRRTVQRQVALIACRGLGAAYPPSVARQAIAQQSAMRGGRDMAQHCVTCGDRCQHIRPAITVPKSGALDLEADAQPGRVCHDMAQAHLDSFARVIAPYPATFRSLQALTVEDFSRRLGCETRRQTRGPNQLAVHRIKQAVSAPRWTRHAPFKQVGCHLLTCAPFQEVLRHPLPGSRSRLPVGRASRVMAGSNQPCGACGQSAADRGSQAAHNASAPDRRWAGCGSCRRKVQVCASPSVTPIGVTI